jgi:hypothetical protein
LRRLIIGRGGFRHLFQNFSLKALKKRNSPRINTDERDFQVFICVFNEKISVYPRLSVVKTGFQILLCVITKQEGESGI